MNFVRLSYVKNYKADGDEVGPVKWKGNNLCRTTGNDY